MARRVPIAPSLGTLVAETSIPRGAKRTPTAPSASVRCSARRLPVARDHVLLRMAEAVAIADRERSRRGRRPRSMNPGVDEVLLP
jgi:hypothetical protein